MKKARRNDKRLITLTALCLAAAFCAQWTGIQPVKPVPIMAPETLSPKGRGPEADRVADTKTIREGSKELTLRFVSQDQSRIDRIDVYDGDSKVQSIVKPAIYHRFDKGWTESCVDLNFDGYLDLQFLKQGCDDTRAYYNCYLWNPALGRFELCAALGNLKNLEALPKTKTLITSAFGQGLLIVRELKWRDGVLETVAISLNRNNYMYFQNALTARCEYKKEDGVWVNAASFDWSESDDGGKAAWKDERPASPYIAPALMFPRLDELKTLAEYRELYENWQGLPEDKRLGSGLYSLLLKIAYDHNQDFLKAGGGISGGRLSALRFASQERTQGEMDPVNCGRFARYSDMESVGRRLFGSGFALSRPTPPPELFSEYGDRDFYTEQIFPAVEGVDTYRIFDFVKETENGVVLEALVCDVVGGRVLMEQGCRRYESLEESIGYVADDGIPWFYEGFDPAGLPRRRYTFSQTPDGRYVADTAIQNGDLLDE